MVKNGKNQWLLPAVGIGGLVLGAFLSAKFDLDDLFEGRKKKRGKKWMKNIRDDEDVYLVTDEDYNRLDITKPKNMRSKMKQQKQKRVVYGDKQPSTFAGFVNTVSPYGQGNTRELTRLPGFSDQSKVNTFGNSINLY